jgi:thiol:disulfide interchange protein DsbD
MGTALAAALTMPPLPAFGVFTALAMGMALPYALLTIFPSLLHKLPRPGGWMVLFKRMMAFPLLGSGVWLLWVFGMQTGLGGVIATLGGLVLAGLFMSLLAEEGGVRRPWPRRIVGAAALATIVIPLWAIRTHTPEPGALAWERFSEERLEELRRSGTPTFVDFTAAWCITCQVNKRFVLRSPEIEALFTTRGVRVLAADWTTYDPLITRALEKIGSRGVPTNVYYPPHGAPIVFPSVLTRRAVKAAVEGSTPEPRRQTQ